MKFRLVRKDNSIIEGDAFDLPDVFGRVVSEDKYMIEVRLIPETDTEEAALKNMNSNKDGEKYGL